VKRNTYEVGSWVRFNLDGNSYAYGVVISDDQRAGFYQVVEIAAEHRWWGISLIMEGMIHTKPVGHLRPHIPTMNEQERYLKWAAENLT
jgi:hypothetical protein